MTVAEVIEYHHRPEDQIAKKEMTVLVRLANQWCWKSGLGYGYLLAAYELLTIEDTWDTLLECFPKAPTPTCKEYASVLEAHLASAHQLADHVFAMDMVTR